MTGPPADVLLPIGALSTICRLLSSGRQRWRAIAARRDVALRSTKAEVQIDVERDGPSDTKGDADIRPVADVEPHAQQSTAGAVAPLTGARSVSVTLKAGIRVVLASVFTRPIDLGSPSRSETGGDAETCHGHPFAA